MFYRLMSLILSDPKVVGHRRSSRWPTTRKEHLLSYPSCAACGTKKYLEVHHVRPFHLFPELELDHANLMTLCESSSHNCHLIFGHLLSWSCWSPSAREDAAAYLARVLSRSRLRLVE